MPFERRQRRSRIERRRLVERRVPDRQISRAPRAGRERHADERRTHASRAVADHAHRETARRCSSSAIEAREAVFGRDDGVVGVDGVGGWRVLGDERSEAERGEQLEALLPIGSAIVEARHVDVGQRHVGANSEQHPALPCRVGMRRQELALLAGERRRILEQRVERAVRRNQIARALLADAGHALDVVDGVSHQREHVDHLFGSDAELRLDAFRVVPRAFIARVEHANARRVVDELKEILVARHDRDRPAVGHAAHRQRADHVVGFEAGEGEHLHAERLARLVHERRSARRGPTASARDWLCSRRAAPTGTSGRTNRTPPRCIAGCGRR